MDLIQGTFVVMGLNLTISQVGYHKFLLQNPGYYHPPSSRCLSPSRYNHNDTLCLTLIDLALPFRTDAELIWLSSFTGITFRRYRFIQKYVFLGIKV